MTKKIDPTEVVNKGIAIISKEVDRLTKAQKQDEIEGLSASQTKQLTDYLITLNSLRRDNKKEQKAIDVDLSQKTPEELAKLAKLVEDDD